LAIFKRFALLATRVFAVASASGLHQSGRAKNAIWLFATL